MKYLYLNFGSGRALFRYRYYDDVGGIDYDGELYRWSSKTWEECPWASDHIIDGDDYNVVEDVEAFIKEHQNDTH